MQCPNCGEKLPSDGTFCGMCGQKIEAPPAPAAAQPPAVRVVRPSKGLPGWAWVLIGMGGIAMVGLGVMLALGGVDGDLPANDIVGTWTGEIASIQPGFSAHLTLEIEANCTGDSVCGTYRIDTGQCWGSLRLSSVGEGGYWFEEIADPSSGTNCSGDAGWQYLRPLSGDRLEYNYTHSLGGEIVSRGVLERD